MSKDELDFEFTVKELDQMVLDAARGEGQNKPKKPIALEALKAKTALNKVRNGAKS
jgi:hypothetical protein